MKEKPRDTKESLFERELVKQILISGLFIGMLLLVLGYLMAKKINRI